MIFRVAAFELRQQLSGHVFWVVFAVSAVMVMGSLWVDELRVGLPDDGLRNGATAIARLHLLWSLFFMFTAAAFVSDAALRDHASGFAATVEATPARRAYLRLGRFAGALAALALCFLSVPGAAAMGSLAPWVEPGTVGTLRPVALLFAFFGLALPNLLLTSAAFFALATATRTLAAAMLGAVVLLVLYGLGREASGSIAALAEPFGFVAYEVARTSGDAGLGGELLANRLLWTAVATALVAAAVSLEPPAIRRGSARAHVPDRPAPVMPAPKVSSRFTAATAIRQFAARSRLEVVQIVASPVFAVLMILGTANAGAHLWAIDTSDVATTVRALAEAFRLLPTVVALFFAGELVWNERERRVHALIGAAPMPDAAYLLPKLLAVALVLAGLAVAGSTAAAAAQALRGRAPDVDTLLMLFALPAAFDWALVAVLALFFQAVAPNKVAGWGYMVLYLIGSLALQQLGFTDPLYRYGRYPGWPLPEALSGEHGTTLYRAYWGALAVVLTVLAFGLVGRGETDPLRTRVRRLPDRLSGPAGLTGIGAAAAFIGLGLILTDNH